MNLRSQISRIILNNFPESILNLFSKNEEFISSTGLESLCFSDLGTFNHDQLLAALRAAYEGGCPVTLLNLDGVKFEFERLEEGVRVMPLDSDQPERFVPELKFLDPLADVRLKALQEATDACQPLLISESHWKSILVERALSEFELAQLVSDILQSPSEFIAGLTRKWRSGNIKADDLFPKSLSYYEALVGPCPAGQDANSYINDVLIPHQKRLLSNSLETGLKYILPMNIDQRMSISPLVAEQPSEILLEALTSYRYSENPFVTVGVLEIALSRVRDDERFGELAEVLVRRLLEGGLSGKGDSDYYKLISSLIKTCLGRISIEEDFWGTPPYWRRLVAFTHAHFLFNVLTTQSIDVELFCEWCDSVKSPNMVVVELLDMQKEPLWHSDLLSPIKLQSEIVSRLIILDKSMKDAKNQNWPSIDVIIDELKNKGGLSFIFSHGPMEGGQRFSQGERSEITSLETDDALKKLLLDIEEDPTSNSSLNLYVCSRILSFDRQLLDGVIQVVGCISIKNNEEDGADILGVLSRAAYISASQSCEEIADAVAATLIREASKINDVNDVEYGYRVILLASAAFIDKEKWLQWLEKKMADYAFSLPKGSACTQLLTSLEMLQVFFPISERCFGRARKFASSALS